LFTESHSKHDDKVFNAYYNLVGLLIDAQKAKHTAVKSLGFK